MKPPIIILLVFLFLVPDLQGQDQYLPAIDGTYHTSSTAFKPSKPVIAEKYKVVMLYSASILLDAVGDGLNDSGHKVAGHALQATSVGVLLATPFVFDIGKNSWGWYIASYVSLRIGLFDMAYNTTRGLPISYVGDSSLWDKGLRATRSPDSWITVLRGGSFVIGFIIPLNEIIY